LAQCEKSSSIGELAQFEIFKIKQAPHCEGGLGDRESWIRKWIPKVRDVAFARDSKYCKDRCVERKDTTPPPSFKGKGSTHYACTTHSLKLLHSMLPRFCNQSPSPYLSILE
jgi:hypothetical protein